MAREVDLGSIVGPQGETGPTGPKGETGATGQRGSRWTSGTAITGTSATATTFSGSGITDALVNDSYLNTDTGNTYRCTVAGNAATAKWVHTGNIKGVKGDTGAKGEKGDTGAKGEKGDTGAKGDKGDTGETGPQGVQGPKGEKGDAFAIAKTFASVSAMNAGFATDGVKEGQFVIIDTGNVDDEDNAKLYVKGAFAYKYITDLSGATGMQGPQGVQGIQGKTGETGAKGEKGDTGATGAKGDTGAAGKDGITPSFEIRSGHLIAIYTE